MVNGFKYILNRLVGRIGRVLLVFGYFSKSNFGGVKAIEG